MDVIKSAEDILRQEKRKDTMPDCLLACDNLIWAIIDLKLALLKILEESC